MTVDAADRSGVVAVDLAVDGQTDDGRDVLLFLSGQGQLGTDHWSATLPHGLAAGRYTILAAAVDGLGNAPLRATSLIRLHLRTGLT